jgi:hypothetical protein
MTDKTTSGAAVGQTNFRDIAFGPSRWRVDLHPQLLAAVTANPADAFCELFDGRTAAYGWSKGDAASTSRGLTSAHFQQHLDTGGTDAEWSLGLNPLRDDSTVMFAVLDIDAPGLTRTEVEQVLRRSNELGLPLVWAQSRSGGLHGYLFLAEPADPGAVRRLLAAWGSNLGWKAKGGGASKTKGDRFYEVFPKQEHLDSDKAGNWIRLPWPGGDRAERRRGVWTLGAPPSFPQWLAYAWQQRVTPEHLGEMLRGVGADAMPATSVDVQSNNATTPAECVEAPLSLSPTTLPGVTLADVRRYLSRLTPERCNDYDGWLHVLMAVHHQFAGTPDELEAIAVVDAWASQSGSYEDGAVEEKWRSFRSGTRNNEITIRSLKRWARVDEIEQAVDELNERYAVLLMGGSSVLVTPPNGTPDFIDSRRLKEYYANRTVMVGDKPRQLINVWLQHPNRRSYNELVFVPASAAYRGIPSQRGEAGSLDFNMWPGFALEPSPTGSCDLFLNHLRNIVCGGDEQLYQWVLMWLAHIVQHPDQLAGTALVLRGPQGAGKTLVGEVMKPILGSALYTKIARPDELTGRFNGQQQSRLLIQVEEGFWAGDKRAEGVLKDMITSPMISIERKFMDPVNLPNYGRLLITSNNAWVVPAGFGERRFAVLDVLGSHANDLAYFAELRREMFENGGCARFFHMLRTEVEIDWNTIQRPPSTKALLEQQIESLDPKDRWLLDRLTEGTLPGDTEGNGSTSKEALIAAYIAEVRRMGKPYDATARRLNQFLSERMGGCVSEERPRRGERRVYCYRFASLTECRAHFAAQLAATPIWPDQTDCTADESYSLLAR